MRFRKKHKKKHADIRYLTIVAMLASVASVLMFFDFTIPIFPTFLKMDFSDIPALIGAFSLGPLAGVLIQLLKSLIHLMRTSTGGVGELASFLIGGSFAGTVGLVYRYHKTKLGAVVAMLCGVVALTTVAIISNFFLLIPFYTKFMPLEKIIEISARIMPSINSLEKVVLYSIVPFNLLKGTLVCFVTFFIYKKLSIFLSSVSRNI